MVRIIRNTNRPCGRGGADNPVGSDGDNRWLWRPWLSYGNLAGPGRHRGLAGPNGPGGPGARDDQGGPGLMALVFVGIRVLTILVAEVVLIARVIASNRRTSRPETKNLSRMVSPLPFPKGHFLIGVSERSDDPVDPCAPD